MSGSSNPPKKYNRKLTEVEKEERHIRRVMANRESARETIRRRKAMHLELTRKAADALEENTNLKKQKELMVQEYNSLKGINEFLKAQLAGTKKVAAGEADEERNSSKDEGSCTATASTSVCQHTQPSIVPYFCHSILPYSDVFPFQFPMPPEGLRQGQECNHKPLFVVPIPCLVPLLTHSGGTHSHHCSCSEANSSDHAPSNHNMRVETQNHRGSQPPGTIIVPGLFSPVRGRETMEACPVDHSGEHLTLVSTLDSARQASNHKPIVCRPRKAEDVYVAAVARRRRKELMKQKNIHCK